MEPVPSRPDPRGMERGRRRSPPSDAPPRRVGSRRLSRPDARRGGPRRRGAARRRCLARSPWVDGPAASSPAVRHPRRSSRRPCRATARADCNADAADHAGADTAPPDTDRRHRRSARAPPTASRPGSPVGRSGGPPDRRRRADEHRAARPARFEKLESRSSSTVRPRPDRRCEPATTSRSSTLAPGDVLKTLVRGQQLLRRRPVRRCSVAFVLRDAAGSSPRRSRRRTRRSRRATGPGRGADRDAAVGAVMRGLRRALVVVAARGASLPLDRRSRVPAAGRPWPS